MKRTIVRLSLVLMASAAIATTAAAQGSSSLLVTPEWLAQHLHDANLVLLHIGDGDAFRSAHIPGAQLISLGDISVSNSTLTLELPPVETLTAAFEARGISADSRIVVYFGENPADANSGDTEVAMSTRVIWTLSYYGLGDRVSLLDGGLPAWRRDGNPVTSEIKTPTSGKLVPHLHPEFFADAAWVSSHLRQPGVSLIDARVALPYTGGFRAPGFETGPIPGFDAGHIPGAKNIPIEALVSESDRLKSASEIEGIFRQAGVQQKDEVVSYCYIGNRATLIWFSARLLGRRARLYDGSWQDWNSRKDLPVAK